MTITFYEEPYIVVVGSSGYAKCFVKECEIKMKDGYGIAENCIETLNIEENYNKIIQDEEVKNNEKLLNILRKMLDEYNELKKEEAEHE